MCTVPKMKKVVLSGWPRSKRQQSVGETRKREREGETRGCTIREQWIGYAGQRCQPALCPVFPYT